MDILDLEEWRDMCADGLPEIRLHLGLDDKNDGSEPGTPGVIKGKVNENMTVGIDRGDLLGATEAAAHPGGHNQKSGLVHGR